MWQPRFENQPILAVAPDRHRAGRTSQTFHCVVVPSRRVRRRPGIATLAVVARPAGRLPPRPTCDAPVTALTSHCPAPSPPGLPAIALLFAPTGVCVPPPRRGRWPRAAAAPLGGVWPSPTPIPLLLCVFVLGSGPCGRRPAPTAAALAGRTVGGVTRHRVCSGTAYASGWRALLLYVSPPSLPSPFLHFVAFVVGPTAVNGRPSVSEAPCFAPRHPVPICALCCLVVGSTVVGRRPPPRCSLAGRSAQSRGSGSARRQCTRRGGAHFRCRASPPPPPLYFSASRFFLVAPSVVDRRPSVSTALCLTARHPLPFCALLCLVVGPTVVGRRPPPRCSLAGRSAGSRGSGATRGLGGRQGVALLLTSRGPYGWRAGPIGTTRADGRVGGAA